MERYDGHGTGDLYHGASINLYLFLESREIMADKRNRLRPKQIKFFVNDQEYELIRKKMAQMGTDNMSAYLRKMAIDGYVVNLDMPELRELTSKMKRISNSENQIAKQLNTTGNIYEADIEEIKKNQEEIYEGIKKILLSLSHLK